MQKPQNTLQHLLVEEFRTCQALVRILRAERRALSNGQVAELLAISQHKEALLDVLRRLEMARQAHLYSLAARLGIDPAQPEVAILGQVCAALPEDSRSLERLHWGLRALLQTVREATQNNRALASAALARAGALQAQLVGLCQLPASGDGQPWATRPRGQEALPAVFAALVAARDALASDDENRLSLASDNLHHALEQLGHSLQPQPAQALRQDAARATGATLTSPAHPANLVEAIADLYQQGNAYRVVLHTSNRTLSYV